MTSLTVNDEQLKQIVHAAILETLPQAKRDALIAEALRKLMEPSRDTYARPGESPLQVAFGYAAQDIAREICAEELKRPELRAQIERVCRAALEKALSDERFPTVADALAETLQRVFTGEIKRDD